MTQRKLTWEEIVENQAQALVSQQEYNFEGANYLNNNVGYLSQPHNIMPSYNYLGWETFGNISYGHPSVQPQESSSSFYQEQFRQPSEEELFIALKEEIKKDKEALEM